MNHHVCVGLVETDVKCNVDTNLEKAGVSACATAETCQQEALRVSEDWAVSVVQPLSHELLKVLSGAHTVSFDFAYTKAVAPGGNVQDTVQVIALVFVDSIFLPLAL